MKVTVKDRAESRAYLLGDYGVKAGGVLVTTVTHVARSGMSRNIRVFIPSTESRKGVYDITYHVARVLGWTYVSHDDGMRVSGCGMDMGFHTVYTLSSVLLGDGYALSQEWL